MILSIAILAGGLATRMRPLTDNLPKSMIEINGKPFIYWQLSLLAKAGIKEIVLCTSHKSETIKSYVKSGEEFGVNVTYSEDGDFQLGTGGAIKQAIPKLGEKFMVLYGDSFLPLDYSEVENAYLGCKFENMMTVYKTEPNLDNNLNFSDGKVIQYEKNSRSNRFHFIDYGLSIFSQEAFKDFPKNTNFDLSVVIQNLIKKQTLAGFEVYNRFYEIGSIQGMQELSEYLRSNHNDFF